MKITIKKLPYEKVISLPKFGHKNPKKPSRLLKLIIRLISAKALKNVNFSYNFPQKEEIGNGPFLILMNHSSFIDFQIISKIFPKLRYNIVCTTDTLIGKELLMRHIGCIPTQKYVHDVTLIKDMAYAVQKLKTSVLMFPEAGYSLDGSATPIPEGLGRLIKLLGVPVIFVKTNGAFHHDPQYNCLQKRKVDVSADVSVLVDRDDVSKKSSDELSNLVQTAFTFDNFKWQYDRKIEITENYRADGLERVLYKCPNCKTEGKTLGKGIHFTCNACGKIYELTTLGRMKAVNGETEFEHIPDWYKWQRKEVKKEIINGDYNLDLKVRIMMIVDYKCVYDVGMGRLIHNNNGFTLTGDDGVLNYAQGPLTCYSLNSDYYWYEIDDVISFGDKTALYYCFPTEQGVVSKARLATEELYKIAKQAVKT